MLEWMNESITQPAWLLIATALVFWIVASYGVYGVSREMRRQVRIHAASNPTLGRVILLEKMLANLATTCADNTARLAGIEEYLQDKQLATAMFGKRPGEPDRPIYLGPGEARRLGNVEFRAGDFPVMLCPKDEDNRRAIEWKRGALICPSCGIRALPAAFDVGICDTKCPFCGSREKPHPATKHLAAVKP